MLCDPKFMKTASFAVFSLLCTLFAVAAGETKGPSLGEKPPQLGLEKVLQAPGDVQPNWKVLKGKVVVLEFWATWCGPCIAAVPHLNELADQFKDKPVQFIAITDEDEKVIGPFLKKKPIHAWVGLDTDRSMFKAYGITGIPHTVVVDLKGNIAAITYPTTLTKNHLNDLLAGKKLTLAQQTADGEGIRPGQVPANGKQEREPVFQVLIRPSESKNWSSASNKGNLTVTGATLFDILSSCYSINPIRILTNGLLPEGRFDFIIKTPATDNDTAKSWLRQAVETTFAVTARRETREVEALVLTAAQELGKDLTPTASTGGSSSSFGGGSLNCVNQSMGSLAWGLEGILKKPVLDETTLTNRYDFHLLWDEKKTGGADQDTIIKALHGQLGLELAPARRSVEVLRVAGPQVEARVGRPQQEHQLLRRQIGVTQRGREAIEPLAR